MIILKYWNKIIFNNMSNKRNKTNDKIKELENLPKVKPQYLALDEDRINIFM